MERMKKLTCPIGNVAVAFADGNVITIPYQERRQLMNQDIGTLSKIMPMNNMQKAAKNGLLLQSINVPGYQ